MRRHGFVVSRVSLAQRSTDALLDENRAKIVQARTIATVMGFLSNPELLPYSLAVIYNTMVDYGKGRQPGLSSDPTRRC